MTGDDRIAFVLAMTNEERVSALVHLAGSNPDVFGEIAADITRQREIRARREAGSQEPHEPR